MSLSDAKCRNAKAAAKGYRMLDAEGLHLFVTPAGGKSWRWRYQVNEREVLATLGRYPDMTLAEARISRDAARRRLHGGGEPAPPPPAPDLRTVVQAWHAMNAPRWKQHHAVDVLASLTRDVLPTLGDRPVDRIAAVDILAVLRPMEGRGAIETARRVKQRLSAAFGYAISHGWATTDPTAGLRAALAPLPVKSHRPALLDLSDARALIAAIDAATGQPATKLALRFLALTATRPGEVNGARWDEMEGLDGEEPLWRVPSARMKMKREHVVPLAPEAVACLTTIHLLTGRGAFVFPNAWNPRRPMSENAMSQMLIRLGYGDRHVPHGWRATFATVMNERHPADRAVIDLMLAHVPKDVVERAYNRAMHVPRRRELAMLWAELLLEGAMPAAELLDGPRRQ